MTSVRIPRPFHSEFADFLVDGVDDIVEKARRVARSRKKDRELRMHHERGTRRIS